MSLLTFICLWFVGSCVATPLIGFTLSRTLANRSGYRPNNRFFGPEPAPGKERMVDRASSVDSPIVRVHRRRPPASAPVQRTSGRSRR